MFLEDIPCVFLFLESTPARLLASETWTPAAVGISASEALCLFPLSFGMGDNIVIINLPFFSFSSLSYSTCEVSTSQEEGFFWRTVPVCGPSALLFLGHV